MVSGSLSLLDSSSSLPMLLQFRMTEGMTTYALAMNAMVWSVKARIIAYVPGAGPQIASTCDVWVLSAVHSVEPLPTNPSGAGNI